MSEKQEFVVRVPRDTKKQFNVLHFNAALNIDVNTFENCKMERETLLKEVKEELANDKPQFGAGSEFGRTEREEAKRHKYERRKGKHNSSPWILQVGGKEGKNLRYRGIREGGVTENASYYVFFQSPDGAFEAFPISEWYKCTPFGRYKALSAEEAEERFSKRHQILNYFQLKKLATKDGERSTDEPQTKKERTIKGEFKVSDMDDWYNNSDNENLSENSDGETPPKKERRKKDNSDKDGEEPGEDSDDGDYENLEVDYMSDSSESDNEKHDIKGVAEETALRDLVVSEDEEEKEEKNTEQIDEMKQNEIEKIVKTEDNGSPSCSAFDSDNPGPSPSHTPKKQKADATRNELTGSIADEVRRYLLRKPYTATELFRKCLKKMPDKRDKLAKIIPDVLAKLQPEEHKDLNGKLKYFLKY